MWFVTKREHECPEKAEVLPKVEPFKFEKKNQNNKSWVKNV